MNERRTVRIDPLFFDRLDQQLAAHRGPNGEPSAGDFLLVELPLIAEAFATTFERMPAPIAERPDYRSHLSSGQLVPRILVTGYLEPDDNMIVLIDVNLDMQADWQ